jgi:hypothetical protein
VQVNAIGSGHVGTLRDGCDGDWDAAGQGLDIGVARAGRLRGNHALVVEG